MYHPLLDQGIDPDDHYVPPISEDGRCTNCGYQFDFEEEMSLFVVEESGVSPGLHFGPAVHWATGYIVCPNCQVHLPYEVSS